MPATTTETRTPPVIGVPVPARPSHLPEGWLRGLVAGAEAALLGWLLIAVPAVATYVATAAAPVLGEASWQSAARTATSLWLLGHGGAMEVGGGATVSLVPLGVTLLALAFVVASARRMRLPSVGAAGFVVPGYAGTVAVLSLVSATPVGRGGALLGALLVAAAGTAIACWRGRLPLPALLRRHPLPTAVGDGLIASAGVLGALALTAVVLGVAATVTGWDRVQLVHQAYGPDVVSSLVMALAQLLLVPTALVWAVAWLAGPGFAIGEGTRFAADGVVTAPLPAVPLLGALPSPDSPGQPWVVVVPVVLGLAAGVWLGLRRPQERFGWALASAGAVAAGTALAVWVLASAASGSAGPGRMAVVGPEPGVLTGTLLLQVGAGALLAVVALHPATHRLAVTGWEGLVGRVRGAGASDREDGSGHENAGDEWAADGEWAAEDEWAADGEWAAEDKWGAGTAPSATTPARAVADDMSPPIAAPIVRARGTAPSAVTPGRAGDAPPDERRPGSGGWTGPRLSQWSAGSD